MEYVNLNLLKAFYFVAREGSVSKAANILLVQQPALSKSVKKLEDALGVSLLQRQGRGIVLTSEGEDIFGKCQEIFSQVNSIQNISNRTDLKLTDIFQISTNDAIATQLLPSVIRDQKEDYPHIRPIINIEGVSTSVQNILEKKSDIGLYFYVPKLPVDLKIIKRIEVKYKLVIAKSMFHSNQVRSQFIGSREAENKSEVKYPALEKIKKTIPNIQIHYSSNGLLTHKQMVLSGMGITILPEFLISDELQSGQLKEVEIGEEFKFNLKVVCRKGERLSTYAKDIIIFLEKLI